MTAVRSPVGDPRHRAAQVVRRPGRPRRHRSRRRRRNGLRSPRPERRRQDDDGPYPVDADHAPTAARFEVAGHDVAKEPDAVRAADRPHGSILGGRPPIHGRGEPPADGRPATSRQAGGPPPRRRAARSVRSRRRGQEARRDLLGRDAAAARPGDDPRRRSADHLPRRADGRTRSTQPPRACGRHPRPRRRRRDDLPDDPVPRGGGSARPPDRRPRPRASWSPRARRTS